MSDFDFSGVSFDTPPGAEFAVEGEHWRVRQWLRRIPGRRLVARCELAGGPAGASAIAKVFLGAGATRRRQREERTLRELSALNALVPDVRSAGTAGSAEVVLIEDLGVGSIPTLDVAVETLLELFHLGYVQRDAHLSNFFWSDGQCWLIDAAAVVRENLPGFTDSIARLLASADNVDQTTISATQTQLSDKGVSAPRLQAQVFAARQQFLRQRANKSERNCTEFSWVSPRQGFSRAASPALIGELTQLDQSSGTQLKAGNTARVWRASFDQQEVVIKRWRSKSLWHGVRQRLRRSRGRRAWRAAQYLRQANIPTPEPLALVEAPGLLRSPVWLVSASADGLPLDQCVGHMDQDELQRCARAAAQLWLRLADWQLVQGDAKASNFLWDGNQLIMLDLDDLRVSSARGYAGQQLRQTLRFLRNFSDEQRVVFVSALQQAGVPVP